jgi:hypothetical protein
MGTNNGSKFSRAEAIERAIDEKKSSSANLGFNTYIQSAALELESELLERESLVSLAARLKSSSGSAVPAPAPNGRGTSDDGWHAVLKVPFPDLEIKRNMLRGAAPYLGAALFMAALSGGVFYYLLNASSTGDRIGASPSPPREPQANSASSNGRGAFVVGDWESVRKAKNLERLGPTPKPAFLVDSVISAPPAPSLPASDPNRISSNGSLDSAKTPAQQTAATDSTAPSLPPPGDAVAAEHSEGRAASLMPAQNTAMTANPIEKDNNNHGPKAADPQLVKLTPDEEARMLKRASDLLSQNDFASARLIYKYLLEHGSTVAESLYNRAKVLEGASTAGR